ncbi:hypothetical protein, partial [Nonomuraea sp. SBT364]|uniref:hypothetical protein n=1 Tax=Nonomuraea sp. SBT364 TaxID=1580530 RepID=UPI0018CCF2E2
MPSRGRPYRCTTIGFHQLGAGPGLEALLAHTGADRVFAVSVGALIALHTATRFASPEARPTQPE